MTPVTPEAPTTLPLARPLAEARAGWARRSVTLKLVAIAFLVVLLMIPAMLLGGLVAERQALRDEARREVASKWGLEQTVGGPVLTVPYSAVERVDSGVAGQPPRQQAVTRYAHVLPDVLDVEGTLAPEVRTRGIFRVVLYNARLRLRGCFPRVDAAALGVAPGALRTNEAFVSIGVPDMAGIKRAVRLRWADTTREADPGLPTSDVFASGLSVPVRLDAATPGYDFAVDLDLNGSGSLGFLPVGKETRVRLASPWASPSFAGAFLPEDRAVSDSGFTARWRVLHLNRNYGQTFLGAFGQPTVLVADEAGVYDRYAMAPMAAGGSGVPSAFGVTLLLPVDEYQKTSRAAKYCMLFVFLTFLTFFFVEVLGGRRIHPVQYLLVGFAITLFYLLLLSFAEHVPFDAAYAGSAVAILSLVALYARAIFGEWRLAGLVAGLLLLFYGYFYVLLQMESYALLFGSLGLFVTLAAVMYLSRRVDWYGASAPGLPAPAVVRAGAGP